MKKSIFNAAFILISLFLTSCSKDENGVPGTDNGAVMREIKSLVTSADWTIVEFIDSGNDETNYFTGFNFTFNSDGTLVAVNGTVTVTGSWSVTDGNDDSSGDDNSNDDSDDDDIDFNIFFASPASFSELTEDWHIVSRSDTRIELIHISGGNGGTDSLTFTKS